jgi:DNA ligase 1
MTSNKKQTPQLLLANTWDGVANLSGWWISEKLDGVRALWDGARLLSRDGNPFAVPNWFTEGLPNMHLDGELWIDRGCFNQTAGIVRRTTSGGEGWRQVRFLIFDAPRVAGPFERRQFFLRTETELENHDWSRLVEHWPCENHRHLEESLAIVERAGGEGLMLRQPGSAYIAGRSSTLLKVKRFHDAEARVIGHRRGTGRNADCLGALVCETPTGLQFALGSGFSDEQRAAPPPLGSLVTYSYQALTPRGVPRFPTFLRVRSESQCST